MKLRKLSLIAALVGTLVLIGCGDDTTNGDNGGGSTDPDVVCADCTPGPDLEDCQNDLIICRTFSDPGAREACINEAAC